MPLCRACRSSLERTADSCPRCGVPGPPRECGRCLLEPPPFRSARAALVYRDGNPVARAIQRWKYDRDEVAGRALAAVLRHSFALENADRWVVPVPALPERLRRRGFNPALTLARAVAPSWRRVLPDLLRRRRATAQVGSGRRARETNARGAFAATPDARIPGRTVLLVDDVFTTGATARSCSIALLDAGAATVDVITLAHTAPLDPFPADGSARG